MSILGVIPRPRRLALAGHVVRVGELRLADLATLEARLRGRHPLRLPPPPEGAGADPGALRRHWARCYLASKHWPPAWDGPEGDAFGRTRAGAASFFVLATRRHNPAWSARDLARLARALSPGEWAEVHAAAYGVHPADEAADRLDPEDAPDAPGTPPTWEAAIVGVCERTGWTFREVAGLTLSQFRAARTGGRARKRRLVPRPGQTARDAAAERKQLFRDALAEGWPDPEAEPCPSAPS